MARMTYFRKILKRDLFKRITLLRTFLSAKDVLASVAAEDYQWRDRIWTPMRTLWTFLVQVLNPDYSCRAALAQVLAEQAAIGEPLDASADPTAYCQARQRLPLGLFKTALQKVGRSLQAKVGNRYLWRERRVWVVDGSSLYSHSCAATGILPKICTIAVARTTTKTRFKFFMARRLLPIDEI